MNRLGLGPSATAHADTATITRYGQYPEQTAGTIPMYSYNKDGHPECQQLVAGIVSRTDGIPLDVDVCDGTMDDPTWSRDTLMRPGLALTEEIRSPDLFVADSTRLSHETVADLVDSDILFVSRRPNTLGIERETKAVAAPAEHWISIGTVSRRQDSAT